MQRRHRTRYFHLLATYTDTCTSSLSHSAKRTSVFLFDLDGFCDSCWAKESPKGQYFKIVYHRLQFSSFGHFSLCYSIFELLTSQQSLNLAKATRPNRDIQKISETSFGRLNILGYSKFRSTIAKYKAARIPNSRGQTRGF